MKFIQKYYRLVLIQLLICVVILLLLGFIAKPSLDFAIFAPFQIFAIPQFIICYLIQIVWITGFFAQENNRKTWQLVLTSIAGTIIAFIVAFIFTFDASSI